MSSSSDEECDPWLERYHEYKRRQRQRRERRRNNRDSQTTEIVNVSKVSIFDRISNHYLTSPILKLVIWIGLLLFFAHHNFGSAFFLLSLPVIIWQSLEEYNRGPTELSAYSVFNRNCAQLEGTFTSEQWERELKYGPGSLRHH